MLFRSLFYAQKWNSWINKIPLKIFDGDISCLTHKLLIQSYLTEACTYMELQQYDKSSEACDNGLYWNASSPEILFNKGQIMVCFGKYEEAIEFYEKALQFQR